MIFENSFCEGDWEASQLDFCSAKFIFLGNMVSASNIDHLKAKGINYVLTVADMIVYNQVDHEGIKHFTASISEVESCTKFIDECRNQNGRILIHCATGVRSMSICLIYLMARFNLSYEEALITIRRTTARSFENKKFPIPHEQMLPLHNQSLYSVLIYCSPNTFYTTLKGYESLLQQNTNPSKEILGKWLEEIERLCVIHVVKREDSQDMLTEFSTLKSAILKYCEIHRNILSQIQVA